TFHDGSGCLVLALMPMKSYVLDMPIVPFAPGPFGCFSSRNVNWVPIVACKPRVELAAWYRPAFFPMKIWSRLFVVTGSGITLCFQRRFHWKVIASTAAG